MTTRDTQDATRGVVISAGGGRFIGLLSVLAITTVYYGGVFRQWFSADDFWFLYRAGNTAWPLWFVRVWNVRSLPAIPEFQYFRPAYLLTFRAEYTLFGLNAAAYHAFNLLIHLACVALLWAITLRITRSAVAAHAAALLFALHPAYAGAVAWIVNGNTPLAVMFGLLSFVLFMRYADSARHRLRWYGGYIATLALALLTHSVAAPFVIVAPAWYFIAHQEPRGVIRPGAWVPFVPVVATLAPYAFIEKWVRDHYLAQAVTLRFGTHIVPNAARYLGMSLYPAERVGVIAVSAAMTIAGAIVVLAIVTRSRILLFALVWYAVSILPQSAYTLGASGRLLYPAGPAFALLVVSALMAVMRLKLLDGSPLRAGIAVAAVSGFMALWVSFFVIHRVDWPPGNYNGRQSAIARQLLDDIRAERRTLPAGTTIYVVRAPVALTQFGDDALRNLVRIYYPGVDARSLPLRSPPYWTEADARRSLKSGDVIVVFRGPVR